MEFHRMIVLCCVLMLAGYGGGTATSKSPQVGKVFYDQDKNCPDYPNQLCVTPDSDNLIRISINSHDSAEKVLVNVSLSLQFDQRELEQELKELVTLQCRWEEGSEFDTESCQQAQISLDDWHTIRLVVGNSSLPIENHTAKLKLVVQDGETDINLPPQEVVVKDRELLVGFSSSDFTIQDGHTALPVSILQPNIQFHFNVSMVVTLKTSHGKVIGSYNVTLNSTKRDKIVSFHGLSPFSSYVVSLSLQKSEVKNLVNLVRSTLYHNVTLENVLARVDEMEKKFSQDYEQLVSKFNHTLQAMEARLAELESGESTTEQSYESLLESEIKKTEVPIAQTRQSGGVGAATQPTPALATEGKAESAPVPSSANIATPITTATQASTTPTTPAAAATTPTTPAGAATTTPTTPAAPAATTPTSATSSLEATEGAGFMDSDGGGFWWLFAAFVVLLVLSVGGYLTFSHREKVRVHVVNLWRGASSTGGTTNARPVTGKGVKTRSKYTPLPTTIHETLTHED